MARQDQSSNNQPQPKMISCFQLATATPEEWAKHLTMCDHCRDQAHAAWLAVNAASLPSAAPAAPAPTNPAPAPAVTPPAGPAPPPAPAAPKGLWGKIVEMDKKLTDKLG